MIERNNFDLLRLGLATTVFLVHAHILSQAPALAVFEQLLSSDFAVKGFFAVSGYLVFMSYERSASPRDYFEKRARRILPAYVFVVVAATVAGALLTDRDLREYFLGGALRYLTANLGFANFLAPALPGVFESNPERAVNGALWTLKIEVIFYLTLPLIAALARRFGRIRTLAALYALSVAYTVALSYVARRTGSESYLILARQFPGQLAFFMAGALVYYVSPSLRGAPWVAAFGASCAYLFFAGSADPWLAPIAISYAVLYFALGFPYLGNFGRFGDFSYGVYILHFPILQILVQAGAFARDARLGFALALAVVFSSAVLLWHLVERPALKRSSHYRGAAGEAASRAAGGRRA